jgi:hypothetical protein
MITELTDFPPKEVSLVDKGANRKKRFPITKKEEVMDHKEILKAVLETQVDEEGQLASFFEKADVSSEGKAAAVSALRIFSSFKDALPEGSLDAISKAAGISFTQSGDVLSGKEPKSDVNKALDGLSIEDKKHIEKAMKESEVQVAQLQKSLKAMQDEQALASWVTKCVDLKGFGKTSQELGEDLKKLADVDTALADKQFGTLKKASEAIQQSAMFKELGGRGESLGGTAMSKVEKKAEMLIEKSDNLTKAEAITQVLTQNPDLYAEYMAENPAQSGLRR